MTTYTPDKWAIIRMTHKEQVIYKVLGAWSSSYLYGTSWRLNSGIKQIEYEPETKIYHIEGYSGSIYSCHKNSYGVNIASMSIWNQMRETYPGQVELLEDRDDWLTLDI